MEELNEESGDEVRDALGLCGRYGSVGPNDRLVTDKTFGIGVFISQLKKLWIEENRAGMMEYLKDFFDDHIATHLDWLDCVEWSDTQRAAYAELKEHLIDLSERYRAVHRVLQYTASREHGIQTPEQLDAEKIEDVYAWDHYDDVARLLNQLKWVTTVDVESEPEEPEPFRERKITPTQFKELLLEEVGNCTEPQHVIFSIVRDMDPNDVAELFQDVFEQLPGVEMTRLDPEDEEPIPTSYQPGGELGDRPVVGFKEQLMEMVRQELSEGARRGAPTHPERLARDHPHQANVQDTQFQRLMADHGGTVTDAGTNWLVTFDDVDKRRSAYDAARAKGYNNLKYHNVPGAGEGAPPQLMLHR